jgi:hypothetical protein
MLEEDEGLTTGEANGKQPVKGIDDVKWVSRMSTALS